MFLNELKGEQKMNKRLDRLRNLSVCKICGDKIIYDALCCETHMNHNHPQLANKNNWFNKYIREASGDEILKIIINKEIIRKQYNRHCKCFECSRIKRFAKNAKGVQE